MGMGMTSAILRWQGQGGRYFDNDSGQFAPPHEAAEDTAHVTAVMDGLRALADEVIG